MESLNQEQECVHASVGSLRYQDALSFLFGRINYERAPKMPYSQRDLSLSRMRQLLELIGNPHLQLNTIHVAGTKGKGSTTAFLSSMLSVSGLRCGSYTSPHLHAVEERFRIDGQSASADQLVDLIEKLQPAVHWMDKNGVDGGPTYFEITTAIAFQHFIEQQVDVAVIEVGLGGRLDSTNVCQPLVSVITSISLDHTKQLGSTLDKIAGEKAGIIKPGIPVVSGATQRVARQVIQSVAANRGAEHHQLGRDFSYENYRMATDGVPKGCADLIRVNRPHADRRLSSVELGLLGEHQAANACIALAALDLVRPTFAADETQIRNGLAAATCWARVEFVGNTPATIVDAAHNVASIEALVQVLKRAFPNRRRLLLVGTTKGKDAEGMLRMLLPHFEVVVCARYQNNPRGLDADQLQRLALRVRNDMRLDDVASISSETSPEQAWKAVLEASRPDDLICVTGSFFIAAEVRELLLT